MIQETRFKRQDARFMRQETRCKILIPCILLFATCIYFIPSSYAQTTQSDIRGNTQTDVASYHESALRRAEIIFTSSIPFTAIHSYISVRGFEMIRQKKVSPRMEDGDWATVIGLTITFSGLVTFWDWLHTRNEGVSNRNLAPKNTIETLPSNDRYQINGLPAINEPVLMSFYMEF